MSIVRLHGWKLVPDGFPNFEDTSAREFVELADQWAAHSKLVSYKASEFFFLGKKARELRRYAKDCRAYSLKLYNLGLLKALSTDPS